jgi:hypothetical protein
MNEYWKSRRHGRRRCAFVIGFALVLVAGRVEGQVNELRSASPPSSGNGPAAAAQFLVSWPDHGRVSTAEPVAGSTSGFGSQETTAARESKPEFSAVVRQLATSTAVVLGLCVAGLLVIRKLKLDQWVAVRHPGMTGNGGPIRVEAVLKLKGNRILEIVRADETRLVIVSDAGGIKAVLPIHSGFLEELQKLDMDSGADRLNPGDTDRNTANRHAAIHRAVSIANHHGP